MLIHQFKDGFEAFGNGYPATSNPHYTHAEAWRSWNRGWHTAQHGEAMNGFKRSPRPSQ